MKMLIADADRDFLQSFKAYFEGIGYEVNTAFDGTQVIRISAEHKPEIVLLGRDIPRISSGELVRYFSEKSIPVIVLLREEINAELLRVSALPQAYISFPFFPSELLDLVKEVSGKAGSDKKFETEELKVDVKHFMLNDKIRVTNKEIDILEILSEKGELGTKKTGPYINSLNNKLTELGSKIRIRYVMKQGYRMVTVYE